MGEDSTFSWATKEYHKMKHKLKSGPYKSQ
jgi:hypothetical protein